MQKLVIQTQYKENYAAHNEDYVHGVSAPHWKFKGGSTYVLLNCDSDVDLADVEAMVSPYITDLNEYVEEYILDTSVVDYKAKVCEDWESVTQFRLMKDGSIYFMKVTDNREISNEEQKFGYMRSEILEKIETWTGCLDSNTGRKDYKVEFLMEDGDFCYNQEELSLWLKNNVKEVA